MYCLHCGAFVPEGAQFCPRCGRPRPQSPAQVTPLPAQAAPPAHAPQDERRKSQDNPSSLAMLTAIIASIAMLVVAGVLWYAARHREDNDGRAALPSSSTPATTATLKPPPVSNNSATTRTTPDATPTSDTLPVTQPGDTQRIQFPRGRTSTIINGSVGQDAAASYLLRAGQGQRMTVHLTSSGGSKARFDIYPPEASTPALAEQADDWAGQLPSAGDYRLRVYTTAGATAYTLEVTVR